MEQSLKRVRGGAGGGGGHRREGKEGKDPCSGNPAGTRRGSLSIHCSQCNPDKEGRRKVLRLFFGLE